MCNCDNDKVNQEPSIVAGQVNYGLLDKAKNLVKGIEGNVKQDFVDGIVFLKRKHICKGCNHRLNVLTMTYNPDDVSKSDKCMACDCFLTARVGPLRGKLWLRNQSCPLGKWGEVKK